MSRNVHELIYDISEILDTVEDEYISVMEERDDLQEKLKDLDEKEKEFPKAYDLGFEEGFAKGEQSMQEKVDKIIDYWVNNPSILTQWFGSETTLFQLLENTKQTCERIEYKKEKEQEIHVGDEVVDSLGYKFIVIMIEGKYMYLIDKRGDYRYTLLNHELFTKTGKHYPIDEMLKELE